MNIAEKASIAEMTRPYEQYTFLYQDTIIQPSLQFNNQL